MSIKALFNLLVCPERFEQMANENSAVSTKGVEGAAKGPRQSSPAKAIQLRYCEGFIWVFLAVGLGALIGYTLAFLCGPSPVWLNRILQLVGVGFPLGATLGRIAAWGQQTWEGKSLHEVTEDQLYRTLYVIGTSLLAVSIVWPTK